MIRLKRRLGSLHPSNLLLERAFEMGRLVEQLMLENPDVDLSTVRLSVEQGRFVIVTAEEVN